MILAIDQGTTGTTCLVVDEELRPIGHGYREIRQHFPEPGWVEHDPEEIWSSVLVTAEEALAAAGARAEDLTAIGITNQRETTAVWDRRSGRPVQNAIVWQDRRTASRCAELPTALIRERTGLVCDPYFSATKLEWILARTEQRQSELAFGTIDSWLVWRLSGGAAHVTDPTNASRTMLLDLETGEWDDELLRLFSIDHRLLPSVVPSSGIAAEATLFGATVPVCGIAGDQQAALFGQGCIHPGQAKATYGTGTFVLANVGDLAGDVTDGLLKTAAAVAPGAPRQFAAEGGVLVGGAALQWLRDGLGIIESAADSERLAQEVDSTGRRVLRACSDRPRRAALGRPGARADLWPHARNDPSASGACRAGGDRPPGRRHPRRAPRRGRRPARRRGSERERLSDAAPGRPDRDPGRGRGRSRGDGPRRRRARRARSGRLARCSGTRTASPAGDALRTVTERRRARRAARRLAGGAAPGDDRRVTWVIAHRGASSELKENTLPAFERAIELGADYVEFDVQASSDGGLVVFHDLRLDRLTAATGPLRRRSLAELQELGIPTLAEVVELTAGRIGVMAELKSPWLYRRHDIVARTLEQLAPDAVVVSFSRRAIIETRRLRPRIRTVQHVGYGTSIRAAADFAWGAGFDDARVTRRGIGKAQRLGLQTFAYTVNDSPRMAELSLLGIDGVFTDCPGRARAALDRPG